MAPDDFDALLRAARWTALSPYLDPAGGDARAPREPIASPFHGGRADRELPARAAPEGVADAAGSVLLIADDVGLGKTVEAGLILTELLLRRRIQRVLVLTPASLRLQWRDELWDKFSLRFEVVDRRATEGLRRRLGMDATPWRSFSRIVASYHYLRQPDVLEQFRAACRTRDGSPHLPWDLLIVDECHNLMPSPFGEDSELCRMLRLVAPQFEHRLFLSATPHNGHTRSFTGLLEMLDPVRFSRTSEMSPAMRGRVEDIVVRRLKRDINAESATPPFLHPAPAAGARSRGRPARRERCRMPSTPSAPPCAPSCQGDRRPDAAPAPSRWRSWASDCFRARRRSPNPGAGRGRDSPARNRQRRRTWRRPSERCARRPATTAKLSNARPPPRRSRAPGSGTSPTRYGRKSKASNALSAASASTWTARHRRPGPAGRCAFRRAGGADRTPADRTSAARRRRRKESSGFSSR